MKTLIVISASAERFALVVVGRAWIMPESRKKPEARKMLVEAAESPPSTARFVGRFFVSTHTKYQNHAKLQYFCLTRSFV